MLRAAAILVGLCLSLLSPVPGRAEFVRMAVPGDLAEVEYDNFLWNIERGADVLFFVCKDRDCGGSGSECSVVTQLTSGMGSGPGIRTALVLGMAKMLISSWSKKGAVGMTVVEQPREMMHGENMGAFGTFRAVWKGRPTLMTFYYVPTGTFNVSAACFTPEDTVSDAVWQIHGLLAGIKIKQTP